MGALSNDNGEFTFSDDRYRASISANPENKSIFKVAVGGAEFIRDCAKEYIYDETTTLSSAQEEEFSGVFDRVRKYRAASNRKQLES
ncbi:type IIL restriction-modification enzyme MmeI [Pseudomonas aeruginosa]